MKDKRFFSLRFCLVNTISAYFRLKNRAVCAGDFILKYILIEYVTPNLSQIYFCKSDIFKTKV